MTQPARTPVPVKRLPTSSCRGCRPFCTMLGAKPPCPASTGQVGQNVRFSFRYSSGVEPGTIVGKFALGDPESRRTGIALANCLREICFYQELKLTLDIQTPALLFADIDLDIDLDTHDLGLMMQDLAPAVQGDQLEGRGAAEALLALPELSKLHGPRWEDPKLFEDPWLGVQSDAE